MPLILKVLSYKGQPLSSELSAQFDKTGGTIGRKAANTLVLTDPENFVSGHHAEILYLNNQYVIKDASKNGTYLINAAANLNNAQALLQNNEVLRIGEYEIQVELLPDAPAMGVTDLPGAFGSPFAEPLPNASGSPFSEPFPASAPSNESPFGSPFGAPNPPPSSLDDFPFADRSNPASPFDNRFPSAEFSPAPPLGGGLGGPFDAAPASDPFAFVERPPTPPFQDSFTPPNVMTAPPAPQDVAAFLKGLDALGTGGEAVSQQEPIPSETPIPVTPSPASFAAEPFSFEAPAPEPESKPEMPASPFQGLESGVAPFQTIDEVIPVDIPPTPEPFLELADMAPASPPPPPAPVAEPVSAVRPVVTASVSDNELMRRFLDGAGIKDSSFLPPEQWPEAMQATGTLFRTIIQGLMDVLRARAEMKSEFRVSVTTIKSFDNNPLKFNPDVESVLKLMMSPNNPAFVHPNVAAVEAFKDIQFHQIAMAAGIQASLAEIMNRFSPDTFEKILGDGIFLQKKARCWELYCEKYPELKTMALENFFGEEFADAYEKQMSLLSRK